MNVIGHDDCIVVFSDNAHGVAIFDCRFNSAAFERVSIKKLGNVSVALARLFERHEILYC